MAIKSLSTCCAHVSHVGCVRSNNEDSIAVIEEHGLFVLADGIGGHEGGEVASRVATDSIARSVKTGAQLVDEILEANRMVVIAGRQSGVRNMGTTVVTLVLEGNEFHVAWVGDSRAYRFNGGPERLTSDHNVVTDMVSAGQIDESEARDHPMRNLLTYALGSDKLEPPNIGTISGRLRPGDRLLLCSDGLHDLLEDGEMHSIIRAATGVQSAVDKLLQAALDRGGPDNISLVLLGPTEPGA